MESGRSSSSIRSRLLWIFALISLAPALVIILTSAFSSYRIAGQRGFDQLDSVVALRASEIEEWTRDMTVDLDTLLTEREQAEFVEPLLAESGSQALRQSLRDSLVAGFEASMAKTKVFRWVALLDEQGKVLAATDSGLEGEDLGAAPFFRQGVQRNFVSPPYRDERAGWGTVIVVSHPVVAPGRGAIGVLASASDIDVINRILSEPAGLGRTGESFLADSDYRAITNLRFSREPGLAFAHGGGLRLALESKLRGHGTSTDSRGVRVLESYTWLPTLQVALIVQQDESEVFGSITSFILIDVLIAFAALLVTAFASSILARGISAPLADLSAAAEQVAGGDLDQVVEVRGGNELRSLAIAFNLMTGRLRTVVGQLRAELAERRSAEEKLRHERERTNQYFESAAVLMVALDRDAKIARLNRRGREILEYGEGELEGRDWFALCLPEAAQREVREIHIRLMAGETSDVEVYENFILTKSGKERLIRWHNSFLRDANGTITGLLSSGEDITEWRRAEDRIQRSLVEKEALLRELHHRTKNNMGVIIGLLDLQAEGTRDDGLRLAFSDIQDRIRSMALVHQKLYESGDLSRINLREYIADLANRLTASYRVDQGTIAIDTDMEDVFVLIDTAIPCGLILNELISNALKHAFPRQSSGTLLLGLRRLPDGLIRLEVADDGIGPPPGFDPRENGRMGMQTIFALGEEQLKGKITFETDRGFSCRLAFRDDAFRPSI
ncbi:MAG TPA: histidine kinase dimerization/phosphoacceptor domain -containing protein [Rectinemataceae bacterium]|nr:histidine kinase dimerization/phosphoacceptor domain -containing protein [Rectinemataceae bacterium]